MDLIALISEYGAWSWVVGGIVLLAIELVFPGGFFIWLGTAAIVTGALAFILPLGIAAEWLIFGVLGLASLFGWLRFTRGRKEVTDRPFLNERAARYVGEVLVLSEAISDGFGKVTIGEAIWRVSGPDLPAGEKVRVSGYEGAMLKVVAAE